ncbi:MAG: hypothetical protein HKM93_21660 [Desulfobacteraceae bacterium]|nr:hypothetical protein [Desulfobacteraceae bacterium]
MNYLFKFTGLTLLLIAPFIYVNVFSRILMSPIHVSGVAFESIAFALSGMLVVGCGGYMVWKIIKHRAQQNISLRSLP